jgi:hypothetical protein
MNLTSISKSERKVMKEREKERERGSEYEKRGML